MSDSILDEDEWCHLTREEHLEIMLLRVLEDWQNGYKFNEVITYDDALELLQEKVEKV